MSMSQHTYGSCLAGVSNTDASGEDDNGGAMLLSRPRPASEDEVMPLPMQCSSTDHTAVDISMCIACALHTNTARLRQVTLWSNTEVPRGLVNLPRLLLKCNTDYTCFLLAYKRISTAIHEGNRFLSGDTTGHLYAITVSGDKLSV